MTTKAGRPIDTVAEGPFFDELAVGMRFTSAPGVTLTAGQATVHQSIVGDRLRLPLDEPLCREVLGAGPLAHPALVWDMAIGQSTLATHHVRANLFYRGLVFQRAPLLGDTLRTTTEVVALRQNTPRAGRRPTGLAALRITTADQHDRPVLDFWRCAMLPLRDADARTGHRDDLDAVGEEPGPEALARPVAGWRLDDFPAAGHGRVPVPGQTVRVVGGDVVTSAPELARLTLNVAQVHHDAAAAGGRRLVYGGHTIGIALAQACRAFPGLITVVGWHGCDHVGPVHEGDTLRSTVGVMRIDPLKSGGCLVHLRSRVWADGETAEEACEVLDWRYVALLA
ncbi:MaoC family dehydratase [Streptomyces fuscichromogenes]|uniref:MaoC family dehydratase n=1 Tax=Streptomyces fuscichromogenes TaxID=1324013 RepID=UPI00380DC71E